MLTFLKLGGSLITDKNKPSTAHVVLIQRIAQEIARFHQFDPQSQLIIGHGSGSFGHVPAKEYDTRLGVHTHDQWAGFSKVWLEARTLNQIVVEELAKAGLPIISIAPSTAVVAKSRKIIHWDVSTLEHALLAGLIPVIYGDVIFDQDLGGTILSTEELFTYLAGIFHPQRIFISGIEQGVFSDYPENHHLISEITPTVYSSQRTLIKGSSAIDVTGGMAAKVENLVKLVQDLPETQAWIFPGIEQGSLYQALSGEPTTGTWIHS
jgi:isopentenyl phosphate kinase